LVNVFSIETTSTVSAVTPLILQNLLVTEFSILASNAVVKADNLATAFHTATTSAVMVIIVGVDTTPSPSGPLPITNLSAIH
jgi:hypothetical protein